ncbi:hypothetical protein [Shewanella metallivivens]|uniref:Uncharacterized protein n=1 Tax=Shewanella metallivivens TaxID=2872342 RepID=A0ABT5TP63_9GAMM|nr:hypothetical protein [Shewanella metallivivens]MDD8059221.1 hypothetical protein [Shewanella metallivivens]
MGIFDLKRIDKAHSYPDWVVNDNERKVYYAINRRAEEITLLISNSVKPLSPSEKKIKKSVICLELGLSGSYIAKHNQLNDYVDGQQRQVNRLSDGLKKTKQQADSNKKRPEAMNKPELVSEVKELRQKLKERDSELYIEQVKHLLDAGLSETQIAVKTRIERLNNEVSSANERLAKVTSALTILQGEVVKSHRINKTKSESVLSLLDNASDPEEIVRILRVSET